MNIRRKTQFCLVFITTILLMYLFYPLYLNSDAEILSGSLHNKQAQLDIFLVGDKNNKAKVISDTPGITITEPKGFNNPKWLKEKGIGSQVVAKIYKKYRKINLDIIANADGILKIHFVAPYRTINKNYAPIWVYYKNIRLNNKVILEHKTKISHKDRFTYSVPMKKGEKVSLSFDAKRFVPNILKFVDFSLFFSFLVISFLIARLFIYWISRFRIIENNSRIDIVFVVAFFILLFIPISKINNLDKSVQENRMLAKYKALVTSSGTLNLHYGKDFENWLNDHFYGRESLIKFYNALKFDLNKYYRNNKVEEIKDNWIIRLWENSDVKISKKLRDNISNGVKEYQKFCQENNIACYIDIAPARTFFIRPYMHKNHVDTWNDFNSLREYLIEQNNFSLIFPLSEMKEANKLDYVYFKTDTHWTDWGAYTGYQAFMKEVRKQFPDLKTQTEADFDVFYDTKVRAEYDRKFWQGFTCNLANMSMDECPLNTQFKYYRHKNEKLLKVSWKRDVMQKDFYYPLAADRKLLLIGNSFSENISYFLAYSFKHTKKLRTNFKKIDNFNLSRWREEIIAYKPDVMLIVLHEHYVSHLQDLAH